MDRKGTHHISYFICRSSAISASACHGSHPPATFDHTLQHVHMCSLIMCICGYCISAGHPSCGKAAVGSVQRVWPGLCIQPLLAINHLLSAGCLHRKRPPDSASKQRCSLWCSNVHPRVHGGKNTHSLTREANVKNLRLDICFAKRLSSSC